LKFVGSTMDMTDAEVSITEDETPTAHDSICRSICSGGHPQTILYRMRRSREYAPTAETNVRNRDRQDRCDRCCERAPAPGLALPTMR
jgi:hypothetical protein